MAHFAELDENNIVKRVVVVNNNECSINGEEDEILGIVFCRKLFNGGNWKQTSYNGRTRKNYAGIGYYYDAARDAYIPPQPYKSWVLDENTCRWTAPTPHPVNGIYQWNEEKQAWEEVK